MRADAWERLLPAQHTDRECILDGVTHGFRITNIDDHGLIARQKNHPSATAASTRDAVEAQIITEINNGRYILCEKPPNIISALAAIPKPDSKDVRLIHDASRPHGCSINDHARGESYTCSTIQTAADMLGKGDFMGKIDLSSAYRSVPLHPADYPRAGLAWQFKGNSTESYMYDTRLMFGARLSACIFNMLTRAVIDIMNSRGHEGRYLVYCDDFFITSPSREICRSLMNELMSVLRELGFAINYNKVVGPATSITFLGVVINTEKYTLSLPHKKLSDLQVELVKICKNRSITYRGLQSICGKLNWACQVIYGGRVYMRRLLDAMSKLRRPHHRVRVSGEMKRDIDWWVKIAHTFNGTAPILDPRPTTPISTDACLTGGGGYYRGEWYYVPFAEWPGVADLSINYKEVLAVLPACHIFGPTWYGRRVALHMDNISATHIIRRGTAKNPIVQHYLREIHALSVIHNFRLVPIYYPGQQNTIADAVSRLETVNGWERLQAALDTVCQDPMTLHPADRFTGGDGHSAVGRTGPKLPGPCIRQQHAASLQLPQEEIHRILCQNGSGASSGHHPADMPLCGTLSRNSSIQNNHTIHKYSAPAARGVGCSKSFRKQSPSGANIARNKESERGHYCQEAAGRPITANAHVPYPPNTVTSGGRSMGGGTSHVFCLTSTIKRNPDNSAIIRPRPPPKAAGHNFHTSGGAPASSLVKDEPVPLQGSDHTAATYQGSPTVPHAGHISRIPIDPERPRGRAGVHHGGSGCAGRASHTVNRHSILAGDKPSTDRGRCRYTGIW